MIIIEWWEKGRGRGKAAVANQDDALTLCLCLGESECITQFRIQDMHYGDLRWYKETLNKAKMLEDWVYD